MLAYVKKHNVPLFRQGEEFGFEKQDSSWRWWSEDKTEEKLPLPRQLALQNMSTSLMVVDLLQDALPVKRKALDKALADVTLPGRIQIIPGAVTKILDVSHNPAAAEFLANFLQDQTYGGKVRAVFSMLADKDILGTLHVMRDHVDEWYIAPLATERGSTLRVLEYCFRTANILPVHAYDSIEQAYDAALKSAQPDDCVLVFGSFYTVAACQ